MLTVVTEFAANLLIRKIEAETRWPPPFDNDRIAEVARRAAFREADEPTLRNEAEWPASRNYVVDPIGDRISTAKADLLYGEDPKFKAAGSSDQGNLDRIVVTSQLPSELHWAEQLRASEGEVWWRIERNDTNLAPCPIVTFHSRELVIPLYIGPLLVAAAFVTEFEDPTAPVREANPPIWRLLEIQSVGRIEHRLYYGYKDSLGQGKNLDDFSETEDLEAVWEHGLPDMLAGRVIYRRDRDRALGRSVYKGSENIMLALNEAMTIGVENVRLAGKKRAVVPAESLTRREPTLPDAIDNGDGSMTPVPAMAFDAGEDVLVAGSMDTELGKDPGANLFKLLEYSFDAEALVTWQNKLVKVLASRCGLTVSFIGEGEAAGEGTAESGTALRVKLLPATSSSRGSGRPWDDAVPKILQLAMLLDGLSGSIGGYGRSYSDSGTAPAVEREDPLPRDETEEVARHTTAVGGPVESVETAVAGLHPDWTEEQIAEEVDRIRKDVQASNSFVGLGLPAGNPEDEPPKPKPEPPAPTPEPVGS
jgi:hypothetical protein